MCPISRHPQWQFLSISFFLCLFNTFPFLCILCNIFGKLGVLMEYLWKLDPLVFLCVCCYWLIWAKVVHLFNNVSKLFFSKSEFLVMCDNLSVCPVILVVSQYPNGAILSAWKKKNKKNLYWSLHIGSEWCTPSILS